MNARIAFYSDLHREFKFASQSKLNLSDDKDIYIFAGDLANLSEFEIFLRELRLRITKPIIVVLGNHDFYGQCYEMALDQYRKICKKYQVTFLEQEIYINHEHKLIVFGATFWSDYETNGKVNDIAMLEVKHRIPDFRYIRTQDFCAFSPDDQRRIAKQTLDKLKYYLDEKYLTQQGCEGYKKIVVSHFPPLATLGNPVYANSIVNAYFSPDYSSVLGLADIWIYGHDHFNLRLWHYSENNRKTLVISNQHGYINEKSSVRECPENTNPVEIDFNQVTQDELDKLKTDFYCDLSIIV